MSEDSRPPEKGDLATRLKRARGKLTGPLKQSSSRSAVSRATHIGIEMVAGVAVGGFIGWWLDKWLGTNPWLLVTMLFLGFAAGLMNAFRAARRLQTDIETGDGEEEG